MEILDVQQRRQRGSDSTQGTDRTVRLLRTSTAVSRRDTAVQRLSSTSSRVSSSNSNRALTTRTALRPRRLTPEAEEEHTLPLLDEAMLRQATAVPELEEATTLARRTDRARTGCSTLRGWGRARTARERESLRPLRRHRVCRDMEEARASTGC